LRTARGGRHYQAAGQKRHAQIMAEARRRALELPEHRAALEARQKVEQAEVEIARLQQELADIEGKGLPPEDAELKQLAERQTQTRQALDFVTGKLPGLKAALAAALRQFTDAAAAAYRAARAAALQDASAERGRLLATFPEKIAGDLDALMVLGVATAQLSRDHFDRPAAEKLAREITAAPPTAAGATPDAAQGTLSATR
jgi:hypothetical protein